MKVYNAKQFISFKTEYNEKYNLIQIFKGLNGSSDYYYTPIDFSLAGLAEKGEIDDFRPSKIISFMTDEATPNNVNHCFIGANHGLVGGIIITSVNHGLQFKHIGLDFIDDAGVKFTLLNIPDSNHFIVLSENVGESEALYKFVEKITGNLKCLDCDRSVNVEKQGGFELKSSRQIEKTLTIFTNGKEEKLSTASFGSYECDYAEIVDHYEIKNLATSVLELKEKRPENGYTENEDIVKYGETMIEMNVKYRVLGDGTVLTVFDNEKKMPVKWHFYHGAMSQLKNNVFNGKSYRYIPYCLPFEFEGVKYDFANGVCLEDKNYPSNFMLDKTLWDKQEPNRIIDIFYNKTNKSEMGFTMGYLPVFDGDNKFRTENNKRAYLFYRSKKSYPIFSDGDIKHIKGVSYKKYYKAPKNGVSVYSIDFENKKYTYVDLLKNKKVELTVNGKYNIVDKTDKITVKEKGNKLFVVGKGSLIICE